MLFQAESPQVRGCREWKPVRLVADSDGCSEPVRAGLHRQWICSGFGKDGRRLWDWLERLSFFHIQELAPLILELTATITVFYSIECGSFAAASSASSLRSCSMFCLIFSGSVLDPDSLLSSEYFPMSLSSIDISNPV